MKTTTTDSATTVGVRPQLFNHGKGDHISSPACSECYLGFEASPEVLRQMLWQMALDFSEEVDATASELLDQIHKTIIERNGVTDATYEWKVIVGFPELDIEINEIGQIRNRTTNDVASPAWSHDFLRDLVLVKDQYGREVSFDHRFFVKKLFGKEIK